MSWLEWVGAAYLAASLTVVLTSTLGWAIDWWWRRKAERARRVVRDAKAAQAAAEDVRRVNPYAEASSDNHWPQGWSDDPVLPLWHPGWDALLRAVMDDVGDGT